MADPFKLTIPDLEESFKKVDTRIFFFLIQN